MVGSLNITRAQLAAFLGDDDRAIKQFEKLFADVDEFSNITIEDLLIQVAVALTQAQEALAGLQALADAMGKEPPPAPDDQADVLTPVPDFVSIVEVSGGTTGLTFTGGPIRSFGTFTMAGTLAPASGGTGITGYAVGDLIYASGATTLSKLADVATGNALISGGVGVAPSWGKIGLTTHVSGVLPVANGGSGVGALGNITKADDTNVTLTLGGAPLGAVITSTSFTMGWTGTLAVARGGTGGGAASGTLLDNITGFAGTGLLARTAAGTYAFRTATGAANQITVTNGSGVSGNPAFSLTSTVILTSAAYAGGTGYIATQGDNIERFRCGHYDSASVAFPTGLVAAQILAGVTSLEIASRDNAAGIVLFRTGSGVTEKMRIAAAGDLQMGGANTVITASRHPQLRSYTVAGLPSASTAAQLIYVSNETGGAVPAFSDGTNWRRVTDRAIVS